MNQRIRYEILIPLYDNNHRPFESELVTRTAVEIKDLLGEITITPDVNIGTWTMQNGKVSTDETVRFFADIPSGRKKQFDAILHKYKEKLKKRFKQHDIYIISYEIEIL